MTFYLSFYLDQPSELLRKVTDPISECVLSSFRRYYEYYDDEDESQETDVVVPHKPPVKTIGDYDLFPLVNKVCVSLSFN